MANGGPGPNGGGSCFVAGTLVMMADGTLKPIENVVVGDKVRGRNSIHNTVSEIEKVKLGDRSLYAFDGGAPFVTAEHPFMTDKGWASINPDMTYEETPELEGKVVPLEAGMKVFTVSNTWELIEEIHEHSGKKNLPLWNLILQNDHTYFADGFLVHNKGGDNLLFGNQNNVRAGLTKEEVQEMIDKAGMGPGRYNPWVDVLNEVRADTEAFAGQVADYTSAGAQQMFNQANLISGNYQPAVQQAAANAFGLQYLSDANQQAAMQTLNDPNLTPEQRNQALLNMQQEARGIGMAEIMDQAGTIESDLTARGADIESMYGGLGQQYYDQTMQRAAMDEARAVQGAQAEIAMAYGGQARELARRGFNPAQIGAIAAQQTDDQALARVAARNLAQQQTAATMRGAEDVRLGLQQQGMERGMDVRFGGEDVARSLRLGAPDFMRQQFTSGVQQGAQFGTAAAQQAASAGGNLASQAAGVQQGAANISQQGALGMSNILSQDYRTDNPPPSGGGGGGSSSALGAIVGGAIGAFSDRRLKDNVIEVGELVKGIKVYLYNYLWDAQQRIGLMADEVEKVFPAAVSTDVNGFKRIDYAKVEV